MLEALCGCLRQSHLLPHTAMNMLNCIGTEWLSMPICVRAVV